MKKNNIQFFVNVHQCKTLSNNIDKFLNNSNKNSWKVTNVSLPYNNKNNTNVIGKETRNKESDAL